MHAPLARLGGAVAVALLALVAGCGGGSSTTAGPTAGSTAEPPTTDLGSTPAVEGSGPESPQQAHNGGPAIAVASLPIGGGASPAAEDPMQQCVDVNWVGANPLPDGIAVWVDTISLSPQGVFEFGGTACGSEQTHCSSSVRWRAGGSSLECVVPVTQVTTPGTADPVTVVVSGSVHCQTQQACADFAAEVRDESAGAHVQVTPVVSTTTEPASPGASAPTDAQPSTAES